MHVRFTPWPADLFPTGIVAASAHVGKKFVWHVSVDHIDLRDPRILSRLDDVCSDSCSILASTPRDTPVRPWGEIRIEEDDIELRELDWSLEEFGLLIRVPRLMSPILRRTIEVVGTNQLTYFDPPDPALYRKIAGERKAGRKGR